MKSKVSGNLDILLVNPHLEFPSDTSGRNSQYRSREYLLNMGLLSIASYLQSIGIGVELCDLSTADNPTEALERLVLERKPKWVGISNQSCHSYLCTLQYADLIKAIDGDIKVVVGGLHACGIPEALLRECKSVDAVVVGEGELVLADLILGTNESGYERIEVSPGQCIVSKQCVMDMNSSPMLDYSLYPDFRSFVPYVEESRGCGSKCTYCVSPLIHKRTRRREPGRIVEEVLSLQGVYGHDEFHFFMEANTFGTNHGEVDVMAGALGNKGLSWRTETRANTFPIHLLDVLTEAGLRVLDIGLESGSPEMLLRMNKTRRPKEYLAACVKLAEKMAQQKSCLLKVNIMLYYGELLSTVKETREYIRLLHSICPLSIGIGPVRMEPGSKAYEEGLRSQDLTLFNNTFWGRVHCYPLDLSEQISFATANEICLEMAQEFQTSRNYYEAKRHSQLRYDMNYQEFMVQSESIPADERQWKK